MKTIQVDVLQPLPESWGVCLACEMVLAQAGTEGDPSERGLDDYPPEWQAEFHRFCGMMIDLSARYGGTVLFRIFDPRSLPGLAKAIRHGAYHYPAFVIEGRTRISGFDPEPLQRALELAGAHVQDESIFKPET
jgi:hypothetical protein